MRIFPCRVTKPTIRELFFYFIQPCKIMKTYIVLFLLSLCCFGCGEKIVTVHENNSGANSSGKGSAVGQAFFYNAFGENLSTFEGVVVTLEGTSLTGKTDSMGRWRIDSIPPATYTIVYSKNGCPDYKSFNLLIPGEGTVYYQNPSSIQITLLPNTDYVIAHDLVLRPFEDATDYVYRDSVFLDSNKTLQHIYRTDTLLLKNETTKFSLPFTVTIFDSTNLVRPLGGYSARVFFSSTKDIDPTDKRTYRMISMGLSKETIFQGGSASADISFLRSTLLQSGFHPGDIVYCVGYVQSYNLLGYYYDYALHTTPYVGYSPHHSEVKSFILP